MSAWYKKSFGRAYLDLYPHRNEAEAEQDIKDLVNMVGLKKEATILDLACGAGRHLLALHRQGYPNLFGLDLSEELLEVAGEELDKAGAPHIDLVHADMRHIPYTDTFDAVLSLFTSFGYFKEDDENLQVFKAIYQALHSNGVFVLDFFNADRVMAELVPVDTQELPDRTIRNCRQITDDKRRVEKTITVITKDGHEQVFHESVRLYRGVHFDRLKTGFKDIKNFGSFKGESFSKNSERLILLCKK
jgi:SAM-dependent methyltransferase